MPDMNTQSGNPRKKNRWSPVIIPISLVGEGCIKIAKNISELTEHAIRFLDPSEAIASKRIAQILIIHAMDEAGKLLEILRKTIEAEHTGASSISIEGFYSHSRKGSEAGSIGILTIDWLRSVVEKLAPSESNGHAGFDSYRTHLENLKENFCMERESALYVDFDEGKWLAPTVLDESWLALDAHLLDILATVTLAVVGLGLPIRDLETFAKEISSPDTIEELLRRVKETAADKRSL